MSDSRDKLLIKIGSWLEVSASGKLSVGTVAAFGLLYGVWRLAAWW